MAQLRKRLKYDAGLKLKVVEFAKNNNNCATARKLGVNEKLVRDWRKQELNIRELPKTKYANSGKTVLVRIGEICCRMDVG